MDISSWDGTLSLSDFCLSACAFAEKWERINADNPKWSWLSLSKSPWAASNEVEGYLSLEKLCFLRPSEGSDTMEEPCCSHGEEPSDEAILVQGCDYEVHCYDFHILYSSTFRVPVLYFRAYHSDGQSMALHDIEKYLPANSAKLIVESKWTFITQEEHPYLNRPWYRLHPCGTSEWMKLLFLGDNSLSRDASIVERYLSSWLSVVGQVVDLRVPYEMLKNLD